MACLEMFKWLGLNCRNVPGWGQQEEGPQELKGHHKRNVEP